MTPFQKRKYLERIGFDFLINDKKGIDVFRNDKFVASSKKNYKNWQDALFETEAIFYERYKNLEDND